MASKEAPLTSRLQSFSFAQNKHNRGFSFTSRNAKAQKNIPELIPIKESIQSLQITNGFSVNGRSNHRIRTNENTNPQSQGHYDFTAKNRVGHSLVDYYKLES